MSTVEHRSPVFSDEDLLFLIKTLMPGVSDRRRMVRVVREDEEILEGMLSDVRIVRHLLGDPEAILQVSPHLFFSVLLLKVQKDFQNQTYTIEQDDRHSAIVFDGQKVGKLLHERRIRDYLVDMLVSFARINSFSTTVRIRRGIWRKIRFSDFDIDSLIEHSRNIDESQRFPSYKRIADICLFTLGIFSDRLKEFQGVLTIEHRESKIPLRRSRNDYAEQGKYFYQAAARLDAAVSPDLKHVMMELSDNLVLATKPLTVMAFRYLGSFKEQVFHQ